MNCTWTYTEGYVKETGKHGNNKTIFQIAEILLMPFFLITCLVFESFWKPFFETNNKRGGAIAQSVEQWSRNQGDALVPFGTALILITRSLGED